MPASASQPSQPHAALIGLIRGTGVFIVGVSVLVVSYIWAAIAFTTIRAHPLDFVALLALLLLALGTCGIRRTGIALAVIFTICGCYFFVRAFIAVTHDQPLFSANFGWLGDPLFVLGSLALLWLLGTIIRLLIKRGYDMWRRVDKTVVAVFAAIFALFAARVFHYLLPAHLPKAINDHLWPHFRDPFNDRGARMLWTWLALYLFYKLIKACLLQILELNSPNLPQNPPPINPDAPEFPRKSPLVQM
jgi:hypothetical protein